MTRVRRYPSYPALKRDKQHHHWADGAAAVSTVARDWWFEADAITGVADNTRLATWPGSVAGVNASQANTGRRGLYRLAQQNGLPGILVDDIDICYEFTIPDVAARTLYLVFAPTVPSGTVRPFKSAATEININANGRVQVVAGFTAGAQLGVWNSADGAITFGAPLILRFQYDKSSTDNDPTLAINGASVSLTRSTAPSGTAKSDAGTARFGCGPSFADAVQGTWFEAQQIPDIDDHAAEEAELAEKWGITLA